MMRIVFGFLIGAVACGVLALGLGIVAMDQGWVSTREGAAAMGIVFFITPAATIIGGLAGALIGALRGR